MNSLGGTLIGGAHSAGNNWRLWECGDRQDFETIINKASAKASVTIETLNKKRLVLVQEESTAAINQSVFCRNSLPGSWLIIDQSWDEGFSVMFELPIELARSIVPGSVMINIETAIELNRKLMALGLAVEERVLLDSYLVAGNLEAIAEIARLNYAHRPKQFC